MQTAVESTIQALVVIVQRMPVGTNLALLHLLWALVRGSFVQSRGAVFPALRLSGFTIAESRRSWRALWAGAWRVESCLNQWRAHVLSQGQWQAQTQAGYRPVAVDLTGFWRPRLQGWASKLYHNLAGRALPAVVLGIIVSVGHVNGHRIPLLRRLVRPPREAMSERAIKAHLLEQVGQLLTAAEVAVVDAGFAIAALQAAQIARFVVRLAVNCTARRNQLPAYAGRGRPAEYGELVRPLARTHQGQVIEATQPDWHQRFSHQARTILVHGWDNLVLPTVKVSPANQTFRILVFFDPLYAKPLVVGTTLSVAPQTVLALYRARWPVEQVPLAAKQILGLHRHFVFAYRCCYRLPELALLAGNVLTYLAAVLPAFATGFWDKQPKPTPGRLRRQLVQADFPNEYPFPDQLRKKRSVTGHLPKGNAAHTRQKQAA